MGKRCKCWTVSQKRRGIFASEILPTMKNRTYMRAIKSEQAIEPELFPSWRKSRHHFFPPSLFGRCNIEQICQFTSHRLTPVVHPCLYHSAVHSSSTHAYVSVSPAVGSASGRSSYKLRRLLSAFRNKTCLHECELQMHFWT